MTRPSEQLEREAEYNRAQLAQTLDELRVRASPGHVMDQVLTYARDGGAGDFARDLGKNLGRQVRDNPLPVLMVGAGMAWLMFGNSTRRRGYGYPVGSSHGSYVGGTTSEHLSEMGSAAAEGAESARRSAMEGAESVRRSVMDAAGRLGSGAHRMGEAVEDARHRVGDAMSRAGEGLSSAYSSAAGGAAALMRSTSAIGRESAEASRAMLDFVREQPVVLGALGLAIGAMIGAALPRSRTEDELMGETSDELKRSASQMAAEQYEKGVAVAKTAAQSAAEAAKEEAERQGLPLPSEPEPAESRVEHAGSIVPSGDEAEMEPSRTGTVPLRGHS